MSARDFSSVEKSRGRLLGVGPCLLALLMGNLAAQEEFVPRIDNQSEAGALPFGGNQPVLGGNDVDILVPAAASLSVLAEGQTLAESTSPGIHFGGLTVAELDGLRVQLKPFLNRGLTERDLFVLSELIVSHYELYDRPVVEVWVPEQAEGSLLVRVLEGRVGEVQVKVGPFSNGSRLAPAIRVQKGDLLRKSDLLETSAWFSRNPFRKAELFAAAGQEAGEADLVFNLVEERPWRVSLNYENTGTEATGEERFLLGGIWGDAFAADHVVAYQATLGADPSQFQAHGVSWEIPLHARHEFIRVSGSWAEVASDLTTSLGPAEATGTSWQAGLSYGRPLPPLQGWTREVSGGFEFKRSDTFLTFGDDSFPSSRSPVDVMQLRLDTRWQKKKTSQAGWEQALRAALVVSPGGLTGRNDGEDFEAYREGADAGYLYLRGGGEWSRTWEQWTLAVRGEVQLASGALLPSEQLGLGGYRNVRGYLEREYLADSGWWLSAEARGPAMSYRLGDEEVLLQGSVFIDHGMSFRADEGGEGILSLGLGVRGQWRQLSARAGWGLPLIKGDGIRAHLGVGWTW